MVEIVLASTSPRRKELLNLIGLRFKVIASSVQENFEYKDNPEELVEKLALLKAQDVAKRVKPRTLVIGADTVVWCGDILGKPRDEKEAFEMLRRLSGKTHFVFTGIAIVEANTGNLVVSHERTLVKFRDIEDSEINAYIDTKEPLDKAGAYGIQGRGAIFIERIEGCYFNVVGLPIAKLDKMLRNFGVYVSSSWGY